MNDYDIVHKRDHEGHGGLLQHCDDCDENNQ
jgi:hypothetical protein